MQGGEQPVVTREPLIGIKRILGELGTHTNICRQTEAKRLKRRELLRRVRKIAPNSIGAKELGNYIRVVRDAYIDTRIWYHHIFIERLGGDRRAGPQCLGNVCKCGGHQLARYRIPEIDQLVGIGLSEQPPAQAAHVVRSQDESLGEFVLKAKTVQNRIRGLELRVDGFVEGLTIGQATRNKRICGCSRAGDKWEKGLRNRRSGRGRYRSGQTGESGIVRQRSDRIARRSEWLRRAGLEKIVVL